MYKTANILNGGNMGRFYQVKPLTKNKKKLIEKNLYYVKNFIDDVVYEKELVPKEYYEELKSIANEKYCKAAINYDINYETEFTTYAYKSLLSSCAQLMRNKKILKDKFRFLSFAKIEKNIESNKNEEYDSYEKYLCFKDDNLIMSDFNFLINNVKLTKKERFLLKCVYKLGFSFKQTGEILKISGERVRQKHNIILNKYRCFIKKRGLTINDF